MFLISRSPSFRSKLDIPKLKFFIRFPQSQKPSRNRNIIRVNISRMADGTFSGERGHKKPKTTGQDNREKGSPTEIPSMEGFLPAFMAVDYFDHQ